MDLKIYYPRIYEGILETDNLIAIENELFEEVLDKYSHVMNNQLLMTSDADQLGVLEKLYGLPVLTDESLDYRRQVIIQFLTESVQLNYATFIERLTVFLGDGNFELTLDYETLDLHVIVHIIAKNKLEQLIRLFIDVLPVNIYFYIENITDVMANASKQQIFIAKQDVTCYTFGIKIDLEELGE